MTPRVLILENEPLLAEAVSERLRHHGYATTVCAIVLHDRFFWVKL